MQLQALQGNSGNDAVGLDGYTVTQSTDCSDDGRQFNNLETCAANCGCGFQYLEYGSSGSSFIDCRCCQFPLNTFGGPSLLYTKNSCFTTTPAPTTSNPGWGALHLAEAGHLLSMALLRVSNARPFLQGNHAGLPCGLDVHYSGGKSFTKALLLVDKTGGLLRQALELTSDDCIWKGRTANTPWKVIDNTQLIHKPETSGLYVSGFNVSTGNRVKLNMNTEHGNTDVAVLVASCRPHHHMNLKMKMQGGKKYHQFVDGEFGRHRAGLSVLQTSAGSSDSEFAISSTWEDLGGSTKASQYLQQVDTEAGNVELMQHPCQEEQSTQAQKICQKHLGAAMQNGVPDSAVLYENCVYDICHGAGEEVAELAVELLTGNGL